MRVFSIEDVVMIYTDARWSDDAEFEQVIAKYSATYWTNYPKAAGIARKLHASGKFEQTRLTRRMTASISGNRHWAFAINQITWTAHPTPVAA